MNSLDMLWLRIRRSTEAKPFEWFFALVTIGWGISLGAAVETFNLSPSYRVFSALFAENTWAAWCFFGALGRMVILTINGSWYRSALLRALASASTLALWLASTIAFALAGTGSTGVLTHALFFIYEFRCMVVAGQEAGRSERAEWARVMTRGAIHRFGRFGLGALFVLGITRGAKASAARIP